MSAEHTKPVTANAPLNRDELCAAARWTLHLAADRARALGDQLQVCRSSAALAEDLAEIRTLLDRAEGVFAFAEGLADG